MDFEAARARLIEHIGGEIRDERVLAAMAHIPRERFVPPAERDLAYENIPLPIGLGQTISQPFIVALMTEALQLTGDERVLEVGTGSGYQTAVLAELARLVVTVERLPALIERAKKALDSLGYTNVVLHLAENTLGWQAEAPYGAIMVTAGAPRIPADLLDQLAVGGRLIIPIGSRYQQELCKVTRGSKKNRVQNLGGCRFVSLIGEAAWVDG